MKKEYDTLVNRNKLSVMGFLFWLTIQAGHAQFVHPGMLHTKNDLEFLKEKIKKGEEPWKSAWAGLQKSDEAGLTWQPHPYRVIKVGFYSKPDIGGADFGKDGDAAYTLALEWYLSGKKDYAEKSIEIINAWSHALDSVTDNNRKLLVGMCGIKFLNAAEIIRHTYKGWRTEDQKAFERMMLQVLYPVIQDFQPGYNGNWDAAIIQTMMCMGIFFDRQDIFDRAYNQCLQGESNGAIDNYFNDFGQCQESGRDQGHTQMGLGYLSTACEIAWKQGRDLYSAYSSRLALGYEYTAKYMLGEEVKYVPYKNFAGKIVFGDSISSQGRGKFAPVYERAYHHYHDRQKMEMPYTKRALEKSRPEGSARAFMPWATLLYAAYPSNQ